MATATERSQDAGQCRVQAELMLLQFQGSIPFPSTRTSQTLLAKRTMFLRSQLFVLALLASRVAGHGLERRANPLDKYPQNTVPNGNGPILYYNGSGPLPSINTISPEPAPLPALAVGQISASVVQEVVAISTGGLINDSCTICQASLDVLHIASLTLSQNAMTTIMIDICITLDLTSLTDHGSCESYFSGTGGLGPYLAQVLQRMSLATGDMQAFCFYEFSTCKAPPLAKINERDWFPPKPANRMSAPQPSGETFNVLHFSDWHMDPRYDVGGEANCTTGLCCRFDSANSHLNTTSLNPSLPASRFGDFTCDSPADLALSAFSSMRQNVNFSSVAWSIFTGDIVSHDRTNQASEALSEYEETTAYETFKAQLGSIPLYATLGNHDSWPSGFNTPNSFQNGTNAFSWNYELLSSLWQAEGWINGTEQQYASSPYGAYAHTTKEGLRVVSINSDFWYTPNIFNYYNYTNPDKSGILRFLVSELLAAETANQRVWIIGHVPSGGGSAIANPSILFHSIVARFSPSTIAGVFFGHTHQDNKQLFYDFASTNSSSPSSDVRNYTALNYDAPLMVAWVGPSIVPLTNYNAGWSVYSVDAVTFEVVNAQVYFANISNTLSWSPEPVWEFEYDARSTYDPLCQWPAYAPLNATFWSEVTERMMKDDSLIAEYLFLASKKSVLTPACVGKCLERSICSIRSSNRAVSDTCA
ncbi:hypothetical protein LTR82_007304 [Friedmanniomyces endolithicus]|uniref:Calcineurin-like phosphoesterase domain-containing protein n=1 Tax=Friedmanniomyces endolithicus TaxID=329885 RepID=A0AAN6J9S8_9PEZI|nr:hypothetical protein LTR82_007304 [Friedmanniomyces endolithicus]